MPSKSYPPDILTQAADILVACQQIDPQLRAGATTQAAFAETLTQTQATQAQIKALELQLTDLRNRRDEQLHALWETAKRWRATVKGIYGDDSSQYELVGGTRLSDRKRTTRRTQESSPTTTTADK
jgi:hypothetical protein